jgi:hypothetical protein
MVISRYYPSTSLEKHSTSLRKHKEPVSRQPVLLLILNWIHTESEAELKYSERIMIFVYVYILSCNAMWICMYIQSLKIEAVCSSETLVSTYKSKQH